MPPPGDRIWTKWSCVFKKNCSILQSLHMGGNDEKALAPQWDAACGSCSTLPSALPSASSQGCFPPTCRSPPLSPPPEAPTLTTGPHRTPTLMEGEAGVRP